MPYSQRHHHGVTIRAHRIERGMTQAQLAECWPGGPVNPQYVQRVEAGKKHIADQETLRRLAALLAVPLWRFGLSEYDPFSPHNLPGRGERMYAETLDDVECFARQTWSLRCAALLPNAEECLRRLNALFDHFQRELPSPVGLESRFLQLYAQVLRLNAVTLVEHEDYAPALRAYEEMRETGARLDDPATLALALMSIGAELDRAGRSPEAVDALEQARDASFNASKHVAAFVHTYLARAYASCGDARRFERAAETARTLAESLGETYGDGTDYVYGRRSSVLAEQSWGYLALGEPRKTLALRDEIAAQIEHDGDLRLRAWIALDWARAHLMLGEPEAGLTLACEFRERVGAMRSPHAQRHVRRLVDEAERLGYGDLPAARELRQTIVA